ncbi:MAG: HDOD domain-containing protein [Thermodesulfobacteriota bacterium]|nr:HDOD domain-containing protein [Thermodesulfobacteriota bacterium]
MNQQKSIVEILKAQLKTDESLPVLSKNSLQLQDEVIKTDPDHRKIEALIKTDPSVTGHVLKMANSPFYRGLEQISTIKEAMVRLGSTELGNIILQAIHKNNFQSKDPFIRKHQINLLKHSIYCAVGSFWTARHLELEDIIPKSFIAGLLHDMGKLYLLTAFEKLKKNKVIDNYPSPALIKEILDKLHARLGYELLSHWNLPEELCTIAGNHHMEKFDQSDILLVLVRLIDQVVNKMKKGNKEEDTVKIASSVEADILGISEIGLAEIEIAIEDYQERTSAA